MSILKPAALTALILTVPALGFAGITTGDKLGVNEAEIRAQMEERGYTVLEIEFDDDEIEVEVLIDGVKTELELARTDGTVRKIEIDD